jgi:hypothetical protein
MSLLEYCQDRMTTVLYTQWHSVRKNTPAECNYDIANKELMALIKALEEWRLECEGAAHTLQLLTNDKNLKYCMSKKLLNRSQPRWSNFLSRFDYEIVYKPGKANGKADALTQRPGDLLDGRDERLKAMELIVLKAKISQNSYRSWQIT